MRLVVQSERLCDRQCRVAEASRGGKGYSSAATSTRKARWASRHSSAASPAARVAACPRERRPTRDYELVPLLVRPSEQLQFCSWRLAVRLLLLPRQRSGETARSRCRRELLGARRDLEQLVNHSERRQAEDVVGKGATGEELALHRRPAQVRKKRRVRLGDRYVTGTRRRLGSIRRQAAAARAAAPGHYSSPLQA